MIDTAKIIVEGGRGGDGIVSFRREKYIAKGGPDGGDGGNGGSVFLCPTREKNTLIDQNRLHKYKAENGENGDSKNQHGKNGSNLTIFVPLGTTILDKNKKILFDLTKEGQSVLVAKGGKGGLGNKKFASATNRVPREKTCGEYGEKVTLRLETKMIADIGLVGMPNAGKSTLLSVITNAKPKIANYPFSSLEPVLGVASYKKRHLVYADIPGVIEGASHGKGLGIQFLKHIERTRAIIHLIRSDSTNPYKDYQTIRHELESFSADLLKKPELIAISHGDLIDEYNIRKKFKNKIFNNAIIFSAPSRSNIDQLQDKVLNLIAKV